MTVFIGLLALAAGLSLLILLTALLWATIAAVQDRRTLRRSRRYIPIAQRPVEGPGDREIDGARPGK